MSEGGSTRRLRPLAAGRRATVSPQLEALVAAASAAARSRRGQPPRHQALPAPLSSSAAVLDDRMAAEFVAGSSAPRWATTTDRRLRVSGPSNDPVGVGFERSAASTGSTSSGNWPKDTEITPISRTVAEEGVMDEVRCRSRTTSRRTSCRRRCPPTDRSVRLPGCVEAKCEGGKVIHEHVYRDHASLSVQVGLLDPAELPATSARAGRQPARSASAADRMTSDAKTRLRATPSAS